MARAGMPRKPVPAVWMAGAFAAAIAVATAAFAAFGPHYQAVVVAVRGSARVAFVFFWLSYASGGLASWFGELFAGLARRRREFGLAFAAALSVHLSLVAVLFRISTSRPIGNAGIVYFGTGAAVAYLLAAASIEPVRRALPPAAWRLLSGLGMEYILLLFILDLVVHPLRDGFGNPLDYAPFSLLAIAAPLLRWSAMLRRRMPG